MKTYYDRRAREYDDWWLGTGLFAERDRPGWAGERDALVRALEELPPARTVDVACGTGFLTRHLPGELVALDQSESMLELAREHVPQAELVVGDALELPFPDSAFERLFTGHFYGHLEPDERTRFLAEARRVANEIVVVDSALRDDVEAEAVQERILNDGSRWTVLKRYFTAAGLAEELGGGTVLHSGRWFVLVRAAAG
jgi:demethylmenaquinone methyltransferase/2-methoxy-6-polyprenyl-1,4-benzoquinol methylase